MPRLTKLQAICTLLWGPRYVTELSKAMGVGLRTAQNWDTWEEDRIPAYVWQELERLLKRRKRQIDHMLQKL